MNGLLHTLLVPPWQHYDEPGHFEYAWLIANKPGLPELGEYVQSMRREVAASMIEHDFFANMGFRPNLLSINKPVWIGISQTDDQPFYYLLVAIPLYLVRTSDITFQLYLARLVSLGLFLLTLFGAYALISELTLPGNSLRLLIPLSVALIPAFVHSMTSVNNDVGAAAFFTLFLWQSVRLLKLGINLWRIILLSLLVVLCLLSKSTTIFVIPLAVIAIAISLIPRPKRIIGLAGISLIGIVLLIAIMTNTGGHFGMSKIKKFHCNA
jgi:4-amino-4-deoxy-L-arabinose transferase-like glycosyltransferase